jgi:hypothetical protein
MTAAFGTRPKRKLNRVLDAIGFEYADYDRLGGDAGGPKRKIIVLNSLYSNFLATVWWKPVITKGH